MRVPVDSWPVDFNLEPHRDAVTLMVREASDRALGWYRTLDRSTNPAAKHASTTGSEYKGSEYKGIEKKGIENKASAGFDPVTEADRAVETELRRRLIELFPDHAVLGEEFGITGDSPYVWTIDPIDGTRAFITGQPMWGTLLGLQFEGKPIAGWMHAPVLGETYYSTGDAATMQLADGSTRPLVCSGIEQLEAATMTCTDPNGMFAAGPEADRFGQLVEATRLCRYSGDCVNYSLLAMGLVDLVVENGLAIYDIVPLIPIVEGAGGTITDLDGASPLEGGYVVAAANPTLHARALEILTAPAGG